MRLNFPTATKARIIQAFGNWNPAMYPGGRHMGIDIAAAVGNPVFAACPGIVDLVHETGAYGYGRHIIIEHGDFKTLYAHQHKVFVRVGQTVDAGFQIGEVGGDPTDDDKVDGASTGPHLHFEVLLSKQPDMDYVKTPYGWAVDGFNYLLKYYAPRPLYVGRVVELTGIRVRPAPSNTNKDDYLDSFSFGKVFDIAEVMPVDGKGYMWARVNSLRTEWVCLEYQKRKYVDLKPLAVSPQPSPSVPAGTSPQLPSEIGEKEIRLDEMNRMIAYLQERAKELE